LTRTGEWTVGNSTSESFGSVEEALAEVRRLRSRLALLEEELKALKLASAGQGATGPAASRATSSRLHGASLAALERFAQQIETARSTTRRTDWAPLRAEPPQSPRTGSAMKARHEGLAAAEEAASRQLTEFRAAINRLREERAQASSDLRNLIKLHTDRLIEASPPGTELSEAPAPASPASEARPAAEPPVGGVATEEPAVAKAPEEVGPQPAMAPDESAGHAGRGRVLPASDDLRGAQKSETPPPASPSTFFGTRASTTEIARERPRRHWLRVAAAIALIAAGTAAAWYMSRPRGSPPGKAPGGAESTLAPAPAGPITAPVPPVENLSAQTPPEAAASQEAAPPADSAPSRSVELMTSREVWLRIVLDGTEQVADTVAAGRTLSFHGDRELLVRAGDAGAVSVVVDGELQGVLGADGAVVTRTFDLSASRAP
jgi:hypothetical protein